MKSGNPIISIITPTYNRANMIGRSIESVIQQTFTDWELIIVDDGSTDNTKAVVESYADERIKYIYQPNQEKCVARNTGIKNARGLYIGFLDNDDYFLPQHLEGFYREIIINDEPKAMLVSGLYIEDEGKRHEHPMYDSSKETGLKFAWRVFMVPTSTCLHRDILAEHQFSEKYYLWEDRHLWLRILIKYPLIQVPNYSCILFEHPERSTKKFYARISMKKTQIYFNAIEDLFKNYGSQLEGEISTNDKMVFVANRSLSFLHIAVRNSQLKEGLFLLKILLKNKPSFLLSPLLYKFMFLMPLNRIRYRSAALQD